MAAISDRTVKILDGKEPGGPFGSLGRELAFGTLVKDYETRIVALEGETGTGGVLTVDTITEATANNGINVQDRLTTTDGVDSGTARVIGGLAYTDPTASTAITGATETLTNLDNTYSLPANSLKVGTKLRIRAVGHQTATTSAETLTFTLRAGSTSLGVTGNIDPVANDMWVLEYELDVRSVGATGHVVGLGTVRSGGRASATVATHLIGTGSGATSHTQLDTTAAQVLAVAVTHQASANDANSVRMDSFTVEVIG